MTVSSSSSPAFTALPSLNDKRCLKHSQVFEILNPKRFKNCNICLKVIVFFSDKWAVSQDKNVCVNKPVYCAQWCSYFLEGVLLTGLPRIVSGRIDKFRKRMTDGQRNELSVMMLYSSKAAKPVHLLNIVYTFNASTLFFTKSFSSMAVCIFNID